MLNNVEAAVWNHLFVIRTWLDQLPSSSLTVRTNYDIVILVSLVYDFFFLSINSLNVPRSILPIIPYRQCISQVKIFFSRAKSL